jgi:hypothetical protein
MDSMHVLHSTRSPLLLALTLSTMVGCGDPPEITDTGVDMNALSVAQKQPRYVHIRDTARAHGLGNAYLLAGIANDETGLAMCWSEATWACQGPASPDCGGGPVTSTVRSPARSALCLASSSTLCARV